MDISYYVEALFETVYLINGVFREKAGLFSYPEESPLYLTVLPLSAIYLPYTLRILGGRVSGNENLVDCLSVTDGRYLIKLKERHNYVYSTNSNVTVPGEPGSACEFFRCVKRDDLPSARRLLTPSLSASIDDISLTKFFAAYSDILPNRFADVAANYLLVGSNKKCDAFRFAFSGKLIDNIEQL